MYPEQNQKNSSKQRGSMLVTALFVIIVLSLLGLAMTRLLSASADAVVHEVYGLRALNAAQSGLQRVMANAFPVTGASTCAAVNINFAGIAGLDNCSASATCTLVEFNADNLNYYRFESTGTCQVGDIITRRKVAADGRLEL